MRLSPTRRGRPRQLGSEDRILWTHIAGVLLLLETIGWCIIGLLPWAGLPYGPSEGKLAPQQDGEVGRSAWRMMLLCFWCPSTGA